MVATIVTAPLFVRMTPEELGMVRAAATGQLLSASSWARRLIMGALGAAEAAIAVDEAAAAAARPGAIMREAVERSRSSAAARTLQLPFKRKKRASKVLAPKKKGAAKLPKHKPSSRRKPIKTKRGRK
jgi:hypothetical protein